MEIKYSENVTLDGSTNEKELKEQGLKRSVGNKQGSTYSGASWQGEIGRPTSRTMSPREVRRSQGTKGKKNPLLGACKSHSLATGHLTYPLISLHSSKPRVRKWTKEMLKAQEKKQWRDQEPNEVAKNVEPESTQTDSALEDATT